MVHTYSNFNYTHLKETIEAVAQMFAQYFPETLIVPSIGNNDGKKDYQGIDMSDKADYYGFYFDHWFTMHSHNSRLKELDEIKKTLMYAGYYRVDVDSKLSILALNTVYFNKKNDVFYQGNEIADQLAWMREQLT